MTLQALSVALQGAVVLLIGGSLLVARRNLVLFRHNHQAMLLKSVMDEYRALVAEDVFDAYPEELASWQRSMEETELAPTMAYYTRLGAISRIGLFYDWVGLLVRDGLLDFELCFEVVPLPFKFWEDTQEFRSLMKSATYAGFWDPFEYLHRRYLERRASERQRPTLRALLNRHAGMKRPSARSTPAPASSSEGTGSTRSSPLR